MLSNGKRCPNAALPGSKYCGVPAHQELALHEPDDEVNPIVEESEPELEALADTAEAESVTEDAAAFGNPEPEEFPAGPGDAPVDGEDQRSTAAPARPGRTSRATMSTRTSRCEEARGAAASLDRSGTCAGCGRQGAPARARSASTQRGGSSSPGAGAGSRRRTRAAASRASSAPGRTGASPNAAEDVRVDPDLSRVSTLESGYG